MKQFIDFEEIPKSMFDEIRIKTLLEAIEKKDLAAAREKQKFIDYCEDVSNSVYFKYVIETKFESENIFHLTIHRKEIQIL
jgi:hypothetical protein